MLGGGYRDKVREGISGWNGISGHASYAIGKFEGRVYPYAGTYRNSAKRSECEDLEFPYRPEIPSLIYLLAINFFSVLSEITSLALD